MAYVGHVKSTAKRALIVVALLMCVPYALAWVPIIEVRADTNASFAAWPVVVVDVHDPCAKAHEIQHAQEAARTGIIPWYVTYGASWLNAGGNEWAMPQEERAIAAEPAGCSRREFARIAN